MPKLKHLVFRIRAWLSLRRLRSIPEPARQFGYLRYSNPYVFEEMILTAFKQAGFKIKCNKRYSGDGGIDGIVFIRGQEHLIQAKRYRSHIDAGHVRAFASLCKRRDRPGLFIQAGRTGRQAWKNREAVIDIVSGQRMLNLMVDKAWQA